MKNFKRGLIIGMAAMTAFSAINMSAAAESSNKDIAQVKVFKVDEDQSDLIRLQTEPPVIRIFFGGNAMHFENSPFVSWDAVYIPLRETLNKLGYNDTNSFIRWNDGIIDLGLYDGETTALCTIEIGSSYVKNKRLSGNQLSIAEFPAENVGHRNIDGEIAILRGDLTYVSVGMMNFIQNNPSVTGYPEFTFDLSYDAHNPWYFNKDCHDIFDGSGIKGEFSLSIPNWWDGKYERVIDGNITKVYHKELRQKYGKTNDMGLLFYITKNTTGVDHTIGGQTLVGSAGDYKFIFGIPTYAKYPTDTKNSEDERLVSEYTEMSQDTTYIQNSFHSKLVTLSYTTRANQLAIEPIIQNEDVYISDDRTFVNTLNEGIYTSPCSKADVSYVVTNFLRCLESSAFEEMKNYCTINCVQEYFGDNEVFGIKSAVADTISYPYKTDEAVAEKEIGITAKITPAPKSSFGKKEITATFKLHLIKQADGTYLIDSFSK